ncbi:MAG: OmpH family outer membrane protein [Bacteroidales bacterium]|jgi:outer membrane protein|nr:OmpH family outer membrane protein [Bacteroidales bacterium]MBP5419352.1 OmpH family outer membrane protein [Bacteroidales bacterium]
MKRIIITLSIVLVALTTSAQKFGHFDSQAFIETMPDYKDAQKTLDQKASTFENQMAALNEEFQKEYQAFQSKAQTMTEKELADKQQELQEMYQKVQTFNQTARESLQQDQQTLMKPILMRLQRAVQEVGAEGGFLYIFESKAGLTLFVSPVQSEDIAPLVKKKLGIN